MKHYILGILLTAAFAFAQDASTDSASSSTGSATVKEPVEQTAIEEPAEQAAPERTPEGYRIIRIDVQETKVYKDSVVKVQKEKELENRKPVPLNFSAGLMASIGFTGIYGERDLHYYAIDSLSGMFFGFQFTLGTTALIPINQYNFAIRTGVLLDSADMPPQTDVLDRIMIDRTKNGGVE